MNSNRCPEEQAFDSIEGKCFKEIHLNEPCDFNNKEAGICSEDKNHVCINGICQELHL